MKWPKPYQSQTPFMDKPPRLLLYTHLPQLQHLPPRPLSPFPGPVGRQCAHPWNLLHAGRVAVAVVVGVHKAAVARVWTPAHRAV
eukprot:349861-Chlamydomonas_euryale.AAC.2